MQKQYGKTAANLETLVNGFLWLLDGTPMPLILIALKEYVLKHNDIPTPADLINIISPPVVEWKPDWPVYISIKKRSAQGEYIYGEDKEYIRKCENFAIMKSKLGIEYKDEKEREGFMIATGQKTLFIEHKE